MWRGQGCQLSLPDYLCNAGTLSPLAQVSSEYATEAAASLHQISYLAEVDEMYRSIYMFEFAFEFVNFRMFFFW